MQRNLYKVFVEDYDDRRREVYVIASNLYAASNLVTGTIIRVELIDDDVIVEGDE